MPKLGEATRVYNLLNMWRRNRGMSPTITMIMIMMKLIPLIRSLPYILSIPFHSEGHKNVNFGDDGLIQPKKDGNLQHGATGSIAQENGTSVTKMSVPVTAEEKTNKKNDMKAKRLLLMALPNEHQITFSQYNDDKTMFAAIEK
ncbi:hypothetical protein Tco_1079273 [Tanacetum coccineum]|uniref:Uncharacterized protein n=1 Tax=Tanacetum coccineum TaxID=301880 RepID=A0ABQ5HTE0_9ASTR